MSKVLECHPLPQETAQDFWERFTTAHHTYAGDQTYNNGQTSAQFNAILIQSLPDKTASLLKTNLDWAYSPRDLQRRAVIAFWPNGKEQETAVKTKFKYEFPLRPNDSYEDDHECAASRDNREIAREDRAQILYQRAQPPVPRRQGWGREPPMPRYDRNDIPYDKRATGQITCFKCGGRGHWRRDCPTADANAPQGNHAPFTSRNPFRQ